MTDTSSEFVGEQKPHKSYDSAMTWPWRMLAALLTAGAVVPAAYMYDTWSDERAVFYGALLGALAAWVFFMGSLAVFGYVVLGPADWAPQVVSVQAPPVVLGRADPSPDDGEPRVRVQIRTRRYLRLSVSGPFRVLAGLVTLDLIVPLWLLILDEVQLPGRWHDGAIAGLSVVVLMTLGAAGIGRARVKMTNLADREEIRLERTVRGIIDW